MTIRHKLYIKSALLIGVSSFLLSCIPVAKELATKERPKTQKTNHVVRETVLKAHNQIRAKHCVAPLQWSQGLEKIAARHARAFVTDGCPKLAHTPKADRMYKGRPSGENLIGAYKPDPQLGEHIQNTYRREIKEYDFSNPEREVKRFKIHGHATQMIWASTTELGCAVARCNKKGIGFDVIYCNYHKHGNFTKPEQYRKNVPQPQSAC